MKRRKSTKGAAKPRKKKPAAKPTRKKAKPRKVGARKRPKPKKVTSRAKARRPGTRKRRQPAVVVRKRPLPEGIPRPLPAALFEKELKLAAKARARARLGDTTFAPDATRTRRGPARAGAPAKATAAAAAELFDPRDAAGNRLTSPVRQQPAGDVRCSAFAIASAMETWLFRNAPPPGGVPSLSVAHVFKLGNDQELIDTPAAGVKQGVLEDACFGTPSPCPDAATRTWKGAVSIFGGGGNDLPAAMCDLLKQGKTLLIAVRIFENFPGFKGNGTYVPKGPSIGAHALCIVGFERDAAGKGVWIVKNSYGTGWGDNGFARLRWKDPFMTPESIVYRVEGVTRAA